MDTKELLEKLSKYFDEKVKIEKKELVSYINKIYNDGKEKIKREPTKYNLFIKEQMEIIKKEDPNMKDKMKYIAKLWNDNKNLKGKTPRKVLK
jgi:hypothetical protein